MNLIKFSSITNFTSELNLNKPTLNFGSIIRNVTQMLIEIIKSLYFLINQKNFRTILCFFTIFEIFLQSITNVHTYNTNSFNTKLSIIQQKGS